MESKLSYYQSLFFDCGMIRINVAPFPFFVSIRISPPRALLYHTPMTIRSRPLPRRFRCKKMIGRLCH